MKKRIIVLALSLLFALASIANGETGKVASKTAVTTDYEKLYNDYQDNPIRADAQYKGKLLKVTGKVDEIGRELLGHPYVTFATGNWSNVQLVFRSSEEDKIAALSKGQTITVIGKCQGIFLSNVELDDCVLPPAQPIFELVKTGVPHDVQVAINRGADVNAQDTNGTTPLMYAAGSNQNPDVIIILLKAGADVNAESRGETALMYAAESNPNPEVITALLKAGANVNAKDIPATTASYTMTALMYAAKFNTNPAIISALCTGGADVNAKDESSGMTVLMWAAELNDNPDVTMALLKAGADASAKDNDYGRTAFNYAQANEKLKGTDALQKLEEAQYGNETNKAVTSGSGNYRVVWDQPDANKGRTLLSRVDPKLPSWVSKQGLTLAVTVSFVVMPDGVVSVVSIDRSTGYADVDSAFKDAIRQWRFSAAKDAGPMTGLIPYVVKPE